MKIAISCETAADFNKELIEQNNLYVLPFQILLGNENKYDGEVTTNEIIEFVNKTGILPKTGAVNSAQFSEHFETLLKSYDAVIHISLSSELRSTYENAVRASNDFQKVYVVDSKSLSTGIALLVLYAKRLINDGLTAEEIYKAVLNRVPSVQASFALKRLDYLYKGGRCNSLVYFGANLLKIRPQIIVKDGKMISGKKYRGSFDLLACVLDRNCFGT